MDILKKKYLIFLLLFIFIPISQAFAADYFPLKVGNKWVYKIDDATDMTSIVSGVEDIAGLKYSTVETSIAGKITQKEYYSKQANNVISLKSIRYEEIKVEVTYEPPKIWIKYPLYPGRIWLEKIKENIKKSSGDRDMKEISRTVKVLAEEIITVPAGTFKCFKIGITQDSKGGKNSFFLWYADRVGIIKQESDLLGSGSAVFELKEYDLK